MSDKGIREKQDKAFEQIFTIAREAGLVIFKTDEADNPYTDRVLIERPVDDADESILDKLILTDDEAQLAKELRAVNMSPKEIAEVIIEEREAALIEDYDNAL